MKLNRSVRFAGIALVGALALAACGSDNGASGESTSDLSGTINAEGSSAQKNAIDQVIADYTTVNPDVTVNYNPTGSGAGITQFIAGQVDFAGSDSPLSTEEEDGTVEQDEADARCANPAWNLPMVIGPVAISYNLPGVDGLVLNAETIANIYLGKITTWNDAAIAALNPGVTLPSTEIKAFYRSDESGTTGNVTKYLNKAVPDVWTTESAKSMPAGVAGEGREKSSGVAEGVKGTEGGIGYVEWSYAETNGLQISQIDNGAGAVELTAETVQAAVATAEQTGEGNNLSLSFDYATKEAGVYPIILVTYEIACSKGLDADKTELVKSFLSYMVSEEEQAKLASLQYVALPDDLRVKVAAAVEAIS